MLSFLVRLIIRVSRLLERLTECDYEIGSLSLTHPCSCNLQEDPLGRCLENIMLEGIRADILEAYRRIRKVLTGWKQNIHVSILRDEC